MKKMSSDEFVTFLDRLVNNYTENYADFGERSILEFLDYAGVDSKTIRGINPLDVISEISRCDMEVGIYEDGEYTFRFKILMGLCEEITYINKDR